MSKELRVRIKNQNTGITNKELFDKSDLPYFKDCMYKERLIGFMTGFGNKKTHVIKDITIEEVNNEQVLFGHIKVLNDILLSYTEEELRLVPLFHDVKTEGEKYLLRFDIVDISKNEGGVTMEKTAHFGKLNSLESVKLEEELLKRDSNCTSCTKSAVCKFKEEVIQFRNELFVRSKPEIVQVSVNCTQYDTNIKIKGFK